MEKGSRIIDEHDLLEDRRWQAGKEFMGMLSKYNKYRWVLAVDALTQDQGESR